MREPGDRENDRMPRHCVDIIFQSPTTGFSMILTSDRPIGQCSQLKAHDLWCLELAYVNFLLIFPSRWFLNSIARIVDKNLASPREETHLNDCYFYVTIVWFLKKLFYTVFYFWIKYNWIKSWKGLV